ncbi:Golgi SNAP receptor complex member 1 isoform X2 [Arapaima gigas]
MLGFSETCGNRRGGWSPGTRTPRLPISSSQDRFINTIGVEIEQLLVKLTGVNDKMGEYTNTSGGTSLNALVMHTLQRHRDILQEIQEGHRGNQQKDRTLLEEEQASEEIRLDTSLCNEKETLLCTSQHNKPRCTIRQRNMLYCPV